MLMAELTRWAPACPPTCVPTDHCRWLRSGYASRDCDLTEAEGTDWLRSRWPTVAASGLGGSA